MTDLIVAAHDVFMQQPMMLDCTAPVTIVGDIHGQYGDLIRLFNHVRTWMFSSWSRTRTDPFQAGWPPTVNYLFLGDYIDRGRWSIETILLLFAIKVDTVWSKVLR